MDNPSNYYDLTNYQVYDDFDSTYYTGLDTSVYIDGVLVDEYLQISWQTAQQETPFYNYNSYEPDVIHSGARITSGRLTLNLKNPSYLMNVLRDNKNPEPRKISTIDSDAIYSSKENFDNYMDRFADLVSGEDKQLQNAYTKDFQVEGSLPLFSPQRRHTLTVVFGKDLENKVILRTDNTIGSFSSNQAKYHPTSHKVKFTGVKFSEESVGVDDSGKPTMLLYSFIAQGYRPQPS